MRTIILSFAILLIGIAPLCAQEGFSITGNAFGVPDGEVILGIQNLRGIDTLASTNMVNGIFNLEGKVEQACVGLLRIAGKGVIPVMLENTKIKVTLGLTGPFIEGGEAQELYNQYSEMLRGPASKLKKTMEECKSAAEMQDMVRAGRLQGEAIKLQEEIVKQELGWIETNGNHFVTAYIVYNAMMQRMPYEDLKKRFELLGAEARASFYGLVLTAGIAEQKKVAVGAIAPDFTVKCPMGVPISLSRIKGKVKLIDFWASWCQPCRQENKNIVNLYKKYHDKGLEIFSVSMDTDEEKWIKAIEDDRLEWNHGSDLLGIKQSPIARQYFISAIPHPLLLDEENRIIAKNLRGDELRKKIAELLK